MTIDEKIRRAEEKEFDLTRSEIRKVISAAKKANKGKLVMFESWFTAGANDMGFQRVECHMIDALNDERLDDVVIHCCLFDRRMSFVEC